MHRTVVTLVTVVALNVMGLGTARAADFIVTWDNVADLVRQRNLSLAAAQLEVDDARARAAASGRWANPTLEVAFGFGSGTGERSTELGLFQSFPLTGRLGTERNQTRLQILSAEAGVAEIERQLVLEARLELVELLAVRRHNDLLMGQLDLSQELATFTRDSAARGEISPIDAAQAKLDEARRKSDLIRLRERRIESVGRLRHILGMSATDTLRVEGALRDDSLSDRVVVPENVPSYRKAVLETQVARLDIDLEQARRVADVELGVVTSFERSEDVPVGFDDVVVFGVHLRAPIPLWNRNQANVRAVAIRAEGQERRMAALAHQVRVQAETDRLNMEQAREVLVEIRGELLPAAELHTESVERAYRDGLGDLQSALRARDQLLEIRIALIDALREFYRYRVLYEAAAVTTEGDSR